MRKLLQLITLISLLLPGFKLHAQSSNNMLFIENKGQWHKEVKYKSETSTGAVFLTNTGFTVVQHSRTDLLAMTEQAHGVLKSKSNTAEIVAPANKFTLHSHAYSATFVNAAGAVIVAENPVVSYNNYFIDNDPSKWAAGCKVYKTITYKSVYPGIDVRYYTGNGNFKYDIVVNPGADPGKIAMQYNGADALKIVNEDLIVKTSTGDLKELSPYSYQIEENSRKKVDCHFNVEGNVVKFTAGKYAKNKTLVIDPELVFSTFTGSSADNWGYTATYGNDGTFFAAGIVFASGFPTTMGAYSTIFNGGQDDNEKIGGYDIGITKFSADGTQLLFATYLGGYGNETPLSLIADPLNNLIIAGRTTSPNFPVTSANIGPCGGYDITITKLSAAGNALLGSRKIGGTAADGLNIRAEYPLQGASNHSIRRNYGDEARSEVMIDKTGNIFLASNTQSANFPVTPGAFQTVTGGNQDGVIIKMSPDLGTVLFSSFLGGSGDDGAFSLAVNSVDNNIYIGGSTVSQNLPGDKSGTLGGNYSGGETDGFVAIVNNDGSTLIKTTYLGTGGNDMLYSIRLDARNFPYVTGTTTGNWPVVNAAFSQQSGKQFIAKLQPDLSAYIYSTVFGPNTSAPNLSPSAFQVDNCENVYVSGWGGEVDFKSNYPNSGTAGLPVTANAIKAATDNSDFYFFVLQKDAVAQLYGSFFGQDGGFGDHCDGGTSRFDGNGVLYQAVCANCGRDVVFPTSPNAWSSTNGSTGCNLAAVKINFNFCNVQLPVHLVTFTGTLSGNVHELNWQVSNQEKGDQYTIEQSVDGRVFTDAYSLVATRNNASDRYVVKLAATGSLKTFYRLKIVSKSVAVTYSSIVLITGNTNTAFFVSVLPDALFVQFPTGARMITMYAADGKMVYYTKIPGNNNSLTIPLKTMKHGTVVLKLRLTDAILVKKIVF